MADKEGAVTCERELQFMDYSVLDSNYIYVPVPECEKPGPWTLHVLSLLLPENWVTQAAISRNMAMNICFLKELLHSWAGDCTFQPLQNCVTCCCTRIVYSGKYQETCRGCSSQCHDQTRGGVNECYFHEGSS